MYKALLFKEDTEPIEVLADEVKEGKYSRDSEFFDLEKEFRVTYVKAAKGGGGPYFRMYYSRNDYAKINPNKLDYYDFIKGKIFIEESKWHKEWKENVESFCELEKYIKNEQTGKWKYADAYYDKYKVCLEFQHSYIARAFEERNKFYTELDKKMIWLCDLTKSEVREDDLGYLEILEDNAKGFFRISENEANLKDYNVYVQVKNGKIYKISELLRRKSNTGYKATVRFFKPDRIYNEDTFIDAIRNGSILLDDIDKLKTLIDKPKTLIEIENESYKWVLVKKLNTNDVIYIKMDENGKMKRIKEKNNCVAYKYVHGKTEYPLKHEEEKKPIWKLIKFGK